MLFAIAVAVLVVAVVAGVTVATVVGGRTHGVEEKLPISSDNIVKREPRTCYVDLQVNFWHLYMETIISHIFAKYSHNNHNFITRVCAP